MDHFDWSLEQSLSDDRQRKLVRQWLKTFALDEETENLIAMRLTANESETSFFVDVTAGGVVVTHESLIQSLANGHAVALQFVDVDGSFCHDQINYECKPGCLKWEFRYLEAKRFRLA